MSPAANSFSVRLVSPPVSTRSGNGAGAGQWKRREDLFSMTITTHTSAITPVAPLPGDRFAPLRARLAGDLLTADSADYDAVRAVVNFKLDRRPLAIVRAADAEDVAAAVN